MIRRITPAQAGEWKRRTTVEIATALVDLFGFTQAAADAQAAASTPSVATIERECVNDIVAMDDGLAPTFPGAARICLWIVRETNPTHYYMRHVWGPTGTLRGDGFGAGHAGIIRWVTRFMIARGEGDVPMSFYVPPGNRHPIIKAGVALAVTPAELQADGRTYTTTANKGDAQLALNNVVVVAA